MAGEPRETPCLRERARKIAHRGIVTALDEAEAREPDFMDHIEAAEHRAVNAIEALVRDEVEASVRQAIIAHELDGPVLDIEEIHR